MSIALAYVTAILSLLFAASLVEQYVMRRQPYHLLWAVALGLFSMAMVLWFLRETLGLNQWIFRLWFLSGAMLVPAYLGTGVLYMMAPRRVSNAFLGYLLVVTVAAVVLVLTAHIRTPEECAAGLTALECLVPSLTLTEMGFFPPWIRVLAAILNLYGGLAVLAGALWAVGMLAREGASAAPSAGPQATEAARRPVSAILAESQRNVMLGFRLLWQNRDFWRRELPVQRAASNIIIMLGLFIGSLGATLNTFDKPAPHLGLFLLAVLVIYAGFLASKEVFETYPHHQLRESLRALRAR